MGDVEWIQLLSMAVVHRRTRAGTILIEGVQKYQIDNT